ncbi:hypothetical protein AN218_00845 [Streptomyces nanshensis]|uniref:Uncharacterized protein n=1 Tax=Streptomyces nanshensis TaxID=518642 RepID=A0A1E7LCY2_9ACTN|nr:hypothetical protein AN218_00845 [Streptomyces nanshensis]
MDHRLSQKTRRTVVRKLRTTGDLAAPLTAVALFTLAAVVAIDDGILHRGPQTSLMDFMLRSFAICGIGIVLQKVAIFSADVIDTAESEAAADAALVFHHLREDLINGADPDRIREALASANVGSAFSALTADLAALYSLTGDDDSAEELRKATAKLRDADQDIALRRY